MTKLFTQPNSIKNDRSKENKSDKIDSTSEN